MSSDMDGKVYILRRAWPAIGKERGDYYNGERGDSPEKIADLIEWGYIEEELPEEQK